MMSELCDNEHTFFEYPTHACDNSRLVQPPQGLPVPLASLKDALVMIGGPNLRHTWVHLTEALIAAAFQGIFMKGRFLKQSSLILRNQIICTYR